MSYLPGRVSYLRLTRRQCVRMRDLFERAEYQGARFEWEKVQAILNSGVNSSAGTRVDLTGLSAGAAEHLLLLLKKLEAKTAHKQAGDALRVRINMLNDALGVSAVDRLGEIM